MIDSHGRECAVFIIVDPERHLLWSHVSTNPLLRIRKIEEDCRIGSERGSINTIPYQQILELGGVSKFYYAIFTSQPVCIPQYHTFIDYSERPDIIEFINTIALTKMHNRLSHKDSKGHLIKPCPPHREIIKLKPKCIPETAIQIG